MKHRNERRRRESAMTARPHGAIVTILLSVALILAAVNSETVMAKEKKSDGPVLGLDAYGSDERKEDSMKPQQFESPVHHIPCHGDCIPFYAQGAYHLFILKDGGWQHLRSDDLLNWEELPMALTKGGPDDPDGEYCFTGHVMEHEGTYHIFYPGVNRKHPKGSMQMMHATSKDFIHFTKHPEETWGPDGIHYKTRAQTPEREGSLEQPTFKDQCIVWNEKEQQWWMFLSAQYVSAVNSCALAVSDDLIHWEQVAPIKGLAPGDCTDVFKIGEWWYRISYFTYWRARDLAGPWSENDSGVGMDFDTPHLLVPKRLFDGKRHVLIGGLRNFYGKVDYADPLSIHCVAIPREAYADDEGFLCTRPAPEATAVFDKTVLDLASKPEPNVSPLLRSWLPQDQVTGSWKYEGDVLVNAEAFPNEYAHCSFEVPDDYMLKAEVQLDHKAVLAVGFREQEGDRRSGYKLVINLRTDEIEINSPSATFPRSVKLDSGKPVTVQAFLVGPILECWVNDAHAFSLRDYDYPKGKLSFDVVNGRGRIRSLTVSVAGGKR